MASYIGSDIGTTGTNTVVIDEKVNLPGKALSEHPPSTPKCACVEEDRTGP